MNSIKVNLHFKNGVITGYTKDPLIIGEKVYTLTQEQLTLIANNLGKLDENLNPVNSIILKDKAINKISELKNLLASLDYKTNKWLDGDLSKEEWDETVALRKHYRAQINMLESAIEEGNYANVF